MKQEIPGKLVLSDGTTYHGYSFGAEQSTDGEVVFATGMVGYPEAFTDPSFCGQILNMTFPLIGNYGVPNGPFESNRMQIQGLLVQDYSFAYSHGDAKQSLSNWLKNSNIPALYNIDTRAVTKRLRQHGVMLGQIVIGTDSAKKASQLNDPNIRNLVAEVSITKPITTGQGQKKVIVVDTGAKENIIRSLENRAVKVKRVPWDYDYLNENWDGLFLTNGPGDPTMADATIGYLKKALKLGRPIFGICLGSQIMGLAAGAKTYKLKYGHRSQNQPCIEVGTKRCYLTTQNHGYAIREKSIPRNWKLWFKNANDGTVEGIKHKSKPYFSSQFHPEATPGPEDTEFLFDLFVDLVKKQK